MAQPFAANSNLSVVQEDLETLPLTVSVDPDRKTVTCSNPYVNIPQNTGRVIIWTLAAPEGVIFDDPAITMFGEQANIAWHPPKANVRTATWFNEPDVQGRSFSYRIHLVDTITNTPLSLDPIIHNDPPSAP